MKVCDRCGLLFERLVSATINKIQPSMMQWKTTRISLTQSRIAIHIFICNDCFDSVSSGELAPLVTGEYR